MTENIPQLREAVADAQQQVADTESELQECITTWRREFAAAVEPAMLDQARRYFVAYPTEAKKLDADGVKRLKGTVRANAENVAKSASERVTLDGIAAAHGVSRLRIALLGDVAEAMKESLQPTFRWAQWFVSHQRAPMTHAYFDDVEEVGAFQSVDKALNLLSAARAQHQDLQQRLDRAEALDLWDGPEG